MALRSIYGNGYRKGASHPMAFRIVTEMSLNEEVMYRNDKEALKELVKNRFPIIDTVDGVCINAAQPGETTGIW